MLFSRVSFEDYYDEGKILKFYDLVSKEFDDVELVWKHNTKTVDSFSESNTVQIKSKGEKLFIHNSINDRGILILGNAQGKVKELLTIFKKSNIGIDVDLGSTYLKAVLYLLLILAAFVSLSINDDGSEVLIILVVCALFLLVVGTLAYVRSFKHFMNADFTLANFSSVILLIGLLCTAPACLLLMPFMTNLNKSQFQKLLDNLE